MFGWSPAVIPPARENHMTDKLDGRAANQRALFSAYLPRNTVPPDSSSFLGVSCFSTDKHILSIPNAKVRVRERERKRVRVEEREHWSGALTVHAKW